MGVRGALEPRCALPEAHLTPPSAPLGPTVRGAGAALRLPRDPLTPPPPPPTPWALQCVALEPRYSSRKTREFIYGTAGGTLTLSSRGWLGNTETVLFQVGWLGASVGWEGQEGGRAAPGMGWGGSWGQVRGGVGVGGVG